MNPTTDKPANGPDRGSELGSTSDREQSNQRERDLMNLAIAGDSGSYSRIFELYRDRIYRMAYALLHDAAEAEDCVQETFLKGLEKLSTYRGESAPNAWFASIALNLCRHRFRDRKHHPRVASTRKLETGERVGRPRSRAAASKAALKESQRLLAVALGFLTEAQREVFVLHYDQELSYEAIGMMLGIRPGAARALAHRAKAVLREQLGPQLWDEKLDQPKA